MAVSERKLHPCAQVESSITSNSLVSHDAWGSLSQFLEKSAESTEGLGPSRFFVVDFNFNC